MPEDTDPKANQAASEGQTQQAPQTETTPPGSQVAPSQTPVIPSGDAPADKATPNLTEATVKGAKMPAAPAPLSPEQAAVAANKPPQAAAAPKAKAAAGKQAPAAGTPPPPKQKIGKEKVQKSKTRFLVGCAGAFLFLFVLFIILMVFMISRSGASNPVMQAFGLDPGGIRNFLQGVVGFSFGILALLFLILAIIRLFRFLGTQKSDKPKRKSNARMTFVHTFVLIFLVFTWMLLSNYIGRIEIAAEQIIAEIVVVEPEDLSALTAPVEIKFSAQNVALALQRGGVQIESMNWDLDGDGIFETPVTTPEVTHLYSRRETVTVGLQVKVVGEEDYRPPYTTVIAIQDAVFEAEPSSGTAPLVVQFDASNITSRDEAASLDWDFDGDGVYELEGPDNMRPRFTFEQIGIYSVQLRVIDKNDNVENYQRNIEITTSEVPILSARIDSTPGLVGPVPLQIRFDASPSKSLKGTIVRYRWDFGDGSELQTGKSVSHIYNSPGFYTVRLTVEDDLGNEAQTSAEVEAQAISSVPEAVITTTPAALEDQPLTGALPFKVVFDAGNSLDADNDIVQYEWDFNDDGEYDEQGEKVEHTFDELGTFTVRLKVEDATSQTGESTLDVVVEEPEISAVIEATPQEGTAPLTVQFDGSSSSTFEGTIVSYEWDFGDGSPKTITGAIVSHKYNDVGTYDAKLKVLTSNNESASALLPIYVREVPLKACFTPSRTSGLAPLTVAFDSKCSTGAVTRYSWAFGDGTESASRNPTHTFDFAGEYTVTLEVTDDKNNVSTVEATITAEGALE